MNRTSQKSNK